MPQLTTRLIASFRPRVVRDRRPGHEARAERAVVALLEQLVVEDEVGGVVRAVGHHDRHGVALEGLEPGAHREPEAVAEVRAQAAHARVAGRRRARPRRRCRRSWRRRRRSPRSRSPCDRGCSVISSSVASIVSASLRAGMTTESFTTTGCQRSTFWSWISRRIASTSYSSVQLGIVGLERAQVADPPAVVALARLVAQLPAQLAAGDPLAELDRLQHRAVAAPAAADVVDGAAARARA